MFLIYTVYVLRDPKDLRTPENEKDADPGGEISVPSFAAGPGGKKGHFREGLRKGRLIHI
jgi:hypothetical protein